PCFVTSLDDSGPGTLRDLIANSGCNPIRFSVTGAVNLTSGELDIEKDLTIEGPGPAQLTVQRAGTSVFRIFNIDNNLTVAISGLTIANGGAGRSIGGGINKGTGGALTVSNCAFSGNIAAAGGGIYTRAALTVTNSIFSGNMTQDFGAGI